jgi:multiple antibiotic resistance protein
MNFNFKEIVTAFMILFAVIDIIGNIPIIIDLRKKAGHIQSEKAALIALFIMVLFLFLGQSLLGLIGIDVNSFAVAGAFILFFIALEMILGITLYKDDGGSAAITATVFPLAFPLIAGPGSLTTLLSLRAEFAIENIIVAVVLNIIFLYVVLKTSSRIERLIGPTGIQIIRKIFGVILLAISVKLFATNIKALFI